MSWMIVVMCCSFNIVVSCYCDFIVTVLSELEFVQIGLLFDAAGGR